MTQFVAPGALRKQQRRAAAARRPDSVLSVQDHVAAPSNVRRGHQDAKRPKTIGGPLGRPSAVLPAYVQNCARGRMSPRALALYTYNPDDPTCVCRFGLVCNSWRHEGECARFAASVLFARLREAFDDPSRDPRGYVFIVLTLDRDGYYSGKPFADLASAYRLLSAQSRKLLKRLNRLCERNGWEKPGSRWAAVVEAHASGMPHVNLAVYAPELAAQLEARRRQVRARGLLKLNWKDQRERERERVASFPAAQRQAQRREGIQRLRRELIRIKRRSILVAGDVLAAVVGTGWGRQSTAERVRQSDRLAGYMTKVAGHADAVLGELAKLLQVPVCAPEGFRRLRSGVGFLPKRRKHGNATGIVVRREPDPRRSAYGAVPLREPKDALGRRMAAEASRLEEDRVRREYEALHTAQALQVPYAEVAPPPVECFRLVGDNFELVDRDVVVDGVRYRRSDNDTLKASAP